MVAWEYPPLFVGGLGVHCKALTESLQRLGIEVRFYLPISKSDYDRITFPPHVYPVLIGSTDLPQAYSIQNTFSWETIEAFTDGLTRVLDPTGVDLIHVHDWMAAPAGLAAAAAFRLPLVATLHSTEYDRSGGGPMHPVIVDIKREVAGRADRLIVVSNYTRDVLKERLSVHRSEISVIHNGLDWESFQTLRRRDYSGGGDVLFLGRVTAQKGPGTFLESARVLIRERGFPHTFTLAGEGDQLATLKRRAQHFGIADRVRFPGRVDGDRLLECYEKAALFVLPAVSEPFGITVLEAMAAGLPVIISHTTGVGEVVRNVVRVEANDPAQLADATERLMNDARLRATLGRAAAGEVQEFTWERVARCTVDVYRSCVDRSCVDRSCGHRSCLPPTRHGEGDRG